MSWLKKLSIKELAIALPILGIFIQIIDAVVQSKAADADLAENNQKLEEELVRKYGLKPVDET